jgi:curved DNA-binding protein CbpA
MGQQRMNRLVVVLVVKTLVLLDVRMIPSLKWSSSSSPFALAKKIPELTSTALRLHKIYNQQPPHDRQLYDILQVPPNATQAQITKSYRMLSRKYHPDKKSTQQQQQQHGGDNNTELRLQQLQQAYQVLKDDSTRIFYHKYGLTDPNLAVLLLLGPKLHPTLWQQTLGKSLVQDATSSSLLLFETLDPDLMRLIGYDEELMLLKQDITSSPDTVAAMEERRIQNIASLLVEQMRPIVEGTIEDVAVYRHAIAQQCDRWKRLPLGAQIIRCVGRAYRHVGQDFLQQHPKMYGNGGQQRSIQHVTTNAAVGLRKRWHSAKHILEAGAISCKLLATEHLWKNKTPQQQQQQQQSSSSKSQQTPIETIEYHNDDDDEIDDFLPLGINDYQVQSLDELEEEQKQEQKYVAQQTMIQALQVEALWKTCKIDIDRVVRKACHMILAGDYFFFPSYASNEAAFVSGGPTSGNVHHGWVARPSGITVDAQQARLTAAQTMVMFGDILVQQSKQGTSWKS